MSLRVCPACKREARTFRRALLVEQSGDARAALVCLRCHGRAVVVVAELVPPKVDTNKAERRTTAEVLAPFIATIEGRIKAVKSTPHLGCPPDVAAELERERDAAFIEAYEGVLLMLKEQRP